MIRMKKEELPRTNTFSMAFWIFCKIIGVGVLIAAIMIIPYQIGKSNTQWDGRTQYIQSIDRVSTEPCEYKIEGFYYKGDCDTIDRLLRFEEKEERLDKEYEKFDEYVDAEIKFVDEGLMKLKAEESRIRVIKSESDKYFESKKSDIVQATEFLESVEEELEQNIEEVCERLNT